MPSPSPTTWRVPASLALGSAVGLVLIQLLCFQTGVGFDSLVRDPAAHLHAPATVGLLSNLGGMGWAAGAAFAGFGWALLRRDPTQRELANLLCYLMFFTLLLGVDDIAELHDAWFPRIYLGSRFHFSEKLVLPLYALLGGLWLHRYRALLRARVPVALGLAVGCFVLSVLFDQRPKWFPAVHHLLEDGFKIVGIVLWARMAFELSAGALVPRGEAPRA
jgi:hypothetical protein